MSESDKVDLPKWASDELAKKEEKHWGDDEALQGIKRKNHGRMLSVWGWIVPTLMVLFTLLFAAALMIWSFHFLSPWGWLSSDQLARLQSIIFSGSIGAVVSTYVQRTLLDENRPSSR